MSTALQPVDLTGAMVGTAGTIDLTQVIGAGGISYAIGGQGTLRLHNESNCGLLCSFDNSIQSFNLPAGGWSDCYPKSSDDALNFTVLYTLSGPGVTLLLSTYYYPGEPIPAQTTLGNSPIGGGNVSTNFSQLTNTGNNPGSSVINVQPNDATSPTIMATNSGNFVVSGDNTGVLTTLLQLIAGASPAVKIAAASIVAEVLGGLKVDGASSLDNGLINTDGAGRITLPNNVAFSALDTGGTKRNLVLMGTDNDTHIHNGASGSMIIFDSKIMGDSGAFKTDGSGNFTLNGITTTLVPVSFAGTAGTANLYQWYKGVVQITLVVFKGFSTAASSFTLALPNAYTVGAFVRVGNIGNFALEFEHSASIQNINVFTGLTSGGGSVANQGGIFAYSLGEVPHAFDTLNFASGGTESGITGFALIEGE